MQVVFLKNNNASYNNHFFMPRFKYRKDEASSHGGSLSRPTSFKEKPDVKKTPQHVTSFKSSFDEFNPFKVICLAKLLKYEIPAK
jgi:hypothetical protein